MACPTTAFDAGPSAPDRNAMSRASSTIGFEIQRISTLSANMCAKILYVRVWCGSQRIGRGFIHGFRKCRKNKGVRRWQALGWARMATAFCGRAHWGLRACASVSAHQGRKRTVAATGIPAKVVRRGVDSPSQARHGHIAHRLF
jgi:hypothetical protein